LISRPSRPHALRSHLVILADAEINEPPLRMLGLRLPLGALDLSRTIDLDPLAVIRAADPLGEEL